ncbi:MAG: hypothetical protein K6G08_11130 [Prevotella sp.]|nr:hypothetical protein [Prevotella sp.]
MAKITLMKTYRQSETLRVLELSDVVAMFRNGEYRGVVDEVRRLYPLFSLSREANGAMKGEGTPIDKLPRVCFASEMENRHHQRVMLGYTGLVLLEVNNLTGYDEAAAIRNGAGEVPQTLLAFVGASGRSVKIVCRGELFPDAQTQVDTIREEASTPVGALPSAADDIVLFHENLYERARLAYNAQMGVTVEKLEPGIDRICYVSVDEEAVYNPMAIPFYARAEKPSPTLSLARTSTQEKDDSGSGQNSYFNMQQIFEFNLEHAFDECEALRGRVDAAEYRHAMLSRLAVHCLETGIPVAVGKRMARYKAIGIGDDDLLVEKVFDNVYRSQLMQRYEGNKGFKPEKNVPTETLLMMKIDLFLSQNYEIRKNVMRGVAEFRERTGIGFSFRDLTEEARNSITIRALRVGIKCWDKDIRRYVNSEDIALYDPLNDYLESLPRWDGKDRVGPLARRIPTTYEDWPELFHLWMRSMVAMWMGKGQLTGNALVPLLLGRQGCGKSSFCRILLPRQLRDYYNDRINFKNETDLNLGLTSFGLINLDEFDKITQRQQIVLKYLVSTADLKYRPPYGTAYSEHRRFASFIGTTNEMMPLTDPSGARRFVCVTVEGDIDFRTPIDYSQLYAQLLQEIGDGERYWPTREQEQQLIRRNINYQQISGLGEMVLAVVQRPADDNDGLWMSLKDLSALLKKTFKGFKEEEGTFRKLGSFLSRPEYRFKSEHRRIGTMYWVKLRE